MKLGTDGFLWSRVSPRARWSKIQYGLLEELWKWIPNHPDVHPSPLCRNMLTWKKDDGCMQKIVKLFIAISIVQLHNDMICPESEGGLKGVRDPVGNVLISDAALRDNLLFNLRHLKERHKQVCGCETCTMMGEYERVICSFSLKLLRDLTRIDE